MTYTFADILIRPKASSSVRSRSDVDTCYELYDSIRFDIPALSASMSIFDTTGPRVISYRFARAMAEAGSLHVFSRSTLFSERIRAVNSLSSVGYVSGLAVGLSEFEVYQKELLSLPEKSIISLDIANGAIIRDIKWDGPATLFLGNFGNPGAVSRNDLEGKIAFRMGIGSGAGCTTREVTGVGAPQAWLIKESRGMSGKPIISDGGTNGTADFVKAVALGANLVMMGRIFAATQEAPQEAIKHDGKWYKPYWGMASSREKETNRHVEGESGYVLYEDKTVKDVLRELREGLCSAMSYSDSHTLTEFWQRSEFLSVTPSVMRESGVRLHRPEGLP